MFTNVKIIPLIKSLGAHRECREGGARLNWEGRIWRIRKPTGGGGG